METEEYFKIKKEIYQTVLNYVEYECDTQDDYQNLIKFFDNQKFRDNRDEFKELLHMILKISNNHHRQHDFSKKIETIITYLKDDITQTFSNSEIFNIFKSNKKIILFLYQSQIIIIDETILYFLNKKYPEKARSKIDQTKFFQFFYPEFKALLDEETKSSIEKELSEIDPVDIENFDVNRQNGENESCVCKLIRNDSIDDFVTFVNQTNLPLMSLIKPSIFETNSFLIENKETTLIEYAAFFGSIQIFNFLKLSGVDLKPSLWLYAVHSNNADLIHLLEDYNVMLPDNSHEKCLEEAVKCHHNEIANYFFEKVKGQIEGEKVTKEKSDNENYFNENVLAYTFHYYNGTFLPTDFSNKLTFFYACKYNYLTLVNLLLKNEEVNVNETIISTIKLSL